MVWVPNFGITKVNDEHKTLSFSASIVTMVFLLINVSN